MLSQMLKFAVECDVIPSTVCRAEGGLTLQGMVYKEVNWFCTTQKTPLIFEISDSLLSEVCYGCSLFQETRKNRVMVFMVYIFILHILRGLKTSALVSSSSLASLCARHGQRAAQVLDTGGGALSAV